MAAIKTIFPALCTPGAEVKILGSDLENINGYRVYNDILDIESASSNEVIINLVIISVIFSTGLYITDT